MKKILGAASALWCTYCINNGALASQVDAYTDEQFASSVAQDLKNIKSVKGVIADVIPEDKLPKRWKTKMRFASFGENLETAFRKCQTLVIFEEEIDKSFQELNFYQFKSKEGKHIKEEIKNKLKELYSNFRTSSSVSTDIKAKILEGATPRTSLAYNNEDSESSYEKITKDDLYWTMKLAWGNLNDYAKKQDKQDVLSTIAAVSSYVENGGDLQATEYLRVIGRLCYEQYEDLNSLGDETLKQSLDQEDVDKLKEIGLEMLRKAAESDSITSEYMSLNGIL